MPKDDHNLDESAKQANAQWRAEWDQGIQALHDGGKMAGAMHKGLTSEGVSGWLAAVAVGTALQAVFLNQNAPEDEDG